MNWLSALSSLNSSATGSMANYSMGAFSGAIMGFGNSLSSAASNISGSPWGAGNNFLMLGLVGNTVGGSSGISSGYSNPFTSAIQNAFQQQPVMWGSEYESGSLLAYRVHCQTT